MNDVPKKNNNNSNDFIVQSIGHAMAFIEKKNLDLIFISTSIYSDIVIIGHKHKHEYTHTYT